LLLLLGLLFRVGLEVGAGGIVGRIVGGIVRGQQKTSCSPLPNLGTHSGLASQHGGSLQQNSSNTPSSLNPGVQLGLVLHVLHDEKGLLLRINPLIGYTNPLQALMFLSLGLPGVGVTGKHCGHLPMKPSKVYFHLVY